ncbi:hypothetical protein PHSY_002126 [Pseudozyma hubeiensis SY62]|uniref:Uncharacterized protein n=1 Tax=Pseudozyma hubeiensis (strain SY62) TaxID=1305764 RepID=R9P0D5_PSEHS|nr:hypothetical protein PHSY_002126 [Pseudozyma hubeiensis SY62]GAC94554.1 hypothetical protein PHSY_002126 [Pseudozyma hubeiensis SY62]
MRARRSGHLNSVSVILDFLEMGNQIKIDTIELDRKEVPDQKALFGRVTRAALGPTPYEEPAPSRHSSNDIILQFLRAEFQAAALRPRRSRHCSSKTASPPRLAQTNDYDTIPS